MPWYGIAGIVVAGIVGALMLWLALWMIYDLILTQLGFRKAWILRESKSRQRYRRRHGL